MSTRETRNKKVGLKYFELKWAVNKPQLTDELLRACLDHFFRMERCMPITYNENSSVSMHRQPTFRNGLFLGALVTNQVNELPVTYNQDSQEERPLSDIGDGDGLAVDSCFLFDPSINILVYETMQKTARVQGLTKLIYENTRDHFKDQGIEIDFIIATHVLKPEAFQRFRNMRSVHKFELKVSTPNNTAFLRDAPTDGTVLGPTARLVEAADADTILVMLQTDGVKKRGKNRKSLRIPQLIIAAREVTSHQDVYIDNLKVTGILENGATEMIDLLEDPMDDKITIEVPVRMMTRFNHLPRFNEIELKYNERKPELYSMYRQR